MLVRRLRSRGTTGRPVTITVEAHGEVLFAPGTEMSRWKNRFSQRITAFSAEAAPANKRPRWGHYGKPLKSTFTSSTATRVTRGGGFFYIAVGSTARHAYYVDQGTGIYGGQGAYEAKILPPWQRFQGSLYEASWVPPGTGRRVGRVMIKGQRGQGFFDKGLKRAFQSMQMRSYQVPSEGISGMAGAAATFPEGLANFRGNTPSDGAFKASLEEWRMWRDAAWQRNEVLGRGHHAGRTRGYLRRQRAARRKAQRARDYLILVQHRREAKARRAREDYEKSRLAAERRAERQREALRREAERKAKGRAREEERKRRIIEESDKKLRSIQHQKAMAAAKAQAVKFARVIKKQFPDTRVQAEKRHGEITGYRVTYTDQSNIVHVERFE